MPLGDSYAASEVVEGEGIDLDNKGLLAGQVRISEENSLVEGLPLAAYGHSFLYIGVGGIYPFASVNYYDRLSRALRSSSGVPGNNNGIPSALMSDVAIYAMGSAPATTRKGTNVAGTWTPSPDPGGVIIIDGLLNSVTHDNPATQLGVKNALDALIRYFRSQAAIPDTDASFAYTGSWTAQTNNIVAGSSDHFTATHGDKVTITTPVGTDFDLILTGWNSSVLPGAAYSVTIDGAAVNYSWNPGTTAGQNDGSTSVFGSGGTETPQAIPLRGLSNSAHTIVLTHNGTTGEFLAVNQLLVASPTPPTIVINKASYLQAGVYTTLGFGQDRIDTYNGFVDEVMKRFSSDNSIVVFDPNKYGWNPNTMVSSLDPQKVHPNDLGMMCYANGIRSLLNKLSPRSGLQIL